MRISVEIAAMLAMVRQSSTDTALQLFLLLVALFAYQRIRHNRIKQQKREEERRETGVAGEHSPGAGK
jgi:hypothetical protein